MIRAGRRVQKADLWPTVATPQFRDVQIGISRTFPAYEDRRPVREVEQLYVD
jgi:hypothetical protein